VIYPTRRVILLMALGAPAALLLGLMAPQLWLAGPGWMALILALGLIDTWLGSPPSAALVSLAAPASLPVGGEGKAVVSTTFERGRPPRRAEVILDSDPRVDVDPARQRAKVGAGGLAAPFRLIPRRRGEAVLPAAWVRWQGPLGLVWKQKRQVFDHAAPVTPNIQAVRDEAVRLFSRESMFGLKSQIETGEGAEFHALAEFRQGMDRRVIDWKQTARHGVLIGKEFRTERNHHVILAIDSGRLMSEPLGAAPRVDVAINAALLLAYVSLKIGDRVGLYSFDDKPRYATNVVAGVRAFATMQRLAARIDYSPEETNFTLGLTELTGRLKRRALVVVFTDFADSTSAQLMIENIGRLMERHLVVFVAFRDQELEDMVAAEPREPDDVSRAVTAGNLLKERDVVLSKLRRLGVHIVDAPADALGPQLLSAYLDLKRRNLL
jgi:uncharacterized protein (DUF58 family)